MIRALLFLIVPMVLGSAITSHPFYLAVTSLKYNKTEKAWQGSVKVFVNDLEDALSRIKHQKVDLLNPGEKENAEKLIKEYLNQRFSIRQNGQVLGYEVIGTEVEEESLYIYIESKAEIPKGEIQIFNTVLYDFLHEQMHIVELEVDGNKVSSKIGYPVSTLTFKY